MQTILIIAISTVLTSATFTGVIVFFKKYGWKRIQAFYYYKFVYKKYKIGDLVEFNEAGFRGYGRIASYGMSWFGFAYSIKVEANLNGFPLCGLHRDAFSRNRREQSFWTVDPDCIKGIYKKVEHKQYLLDLE
jgi:hypothetical protein